MRQVVLDTNVVVAALRSPAGASARVLSLARVGGIEINLTASLYLEYVEVLGRKIEDGFLPGIDLEEFKDEIASFANLRKVDFLLRPSLKDPDDEMVLEAAVASGNADIITHNLRDFRDASQYGIRAMTPAELLAGLEAMP